MDKARFRELDVLRGLASLAVVIFHYTEYFPQRFQVGAHGVELFFAISGFVIFWTLRRSRTLTDFAFSRFSRLYPAYWGALGLIAILALAAGEQLWIGGFVTNATMLQKFIGYGDINTVFWTLAIELAFYVWMAVIFATGKLSKIVSLSCAWPLQSAGHYSVRMNW